MRTFYNVLKLTHKNIHEPCLELYTWDTELGFFKVNRVPLWMSVAHDDYINISCLSYDIWMSNKRVPLRDNLTLYHRFREGKDKEGRRDVEIFLINRKATHSSNYKESRKKKK